MSEKIMYGIETVTGFGPCSQSKKRKRKPLPIAFTLWELQWIADCEELPEMEFDTLESAVEAMIERYADKLEPVEKELGTETLKCFIVDSHHNLVAFLNRDKTVIYP